jgi:hypothetical protein
VGKYLQKFLSGEKKQATKLYKWCDFLCTENQNNSDYL